SVSSAAAPSEAVRTLQPSCWKMRATDSRLARSSSTTRRVAADIACRGVYRRVSGTPRTAACSMADCAPEGHRTDVDPSYSRTFSAVVFFPERRVPCESAAATSSPERRSMSRLVTIAVFLALVLALACDSGPPGPGQVRFANLIPDAPSAIDVCIRP